jgi:phage FluMu protein Com
MRKRQGKVIEEGAEHGAVLAPTFADPAPIKGTGDINWVCGHCDHLLAEHMLPGQMQGIVIKCFSCGTLNEITSALERPGSTQPDSN